MALSKRLTAEFIGTLWEGTEARLASITVNR